ncbi:MAG: signal peptidase I [Clostridia bacterium]|nr:signal peptidase I [Clostridia bacterium]
MSDTGQRAPKPPLTAPSIEQLEAELKYEKRRTSYGKALRSTLYSLLVVAAVAILVAMLFMPILQITGSSMTPVISDGEITAILKGNSFERGDIIAFYYNNKLLVKRVIAFAGEWVDIDLEGNVYVNDKLLEEPYLTEKALGDCSIDLPYQVPDGKLFVMGDHRSTSADSRSVVIGPVSDEQVLGKVFIRFWPLNRFGLIQ